MTHPLRGRTPGDSDGHGGYYGQCPGCGGPMSSEARHCIRCANLTPNYALMVELRQDGLTNIQIDEVLGLSPNVTATAFSRRKRRGEWVPPNPYLTRGSS